MTSGMKTVIYPVQDLATAKAIFTELLGVGPTMDEPYYVGFDARDLHIGLDPNGHAKGMSGPVDYWHVADVPAALEALQRAGAQPNEAAKDVGGGKLVASVKDVDGNVVGLIQDQ